MKAIIVLLATVACCMAASVPIIPTPTDDVQLDAPTGRIISGYPAEHNQLPYQVLILRVVPASGSTTVCGASLLSASWVLSAAECTQFEQLRYNMRFGSINMHSGGIMRTADRVINHPQFNQPARFNNDISLLHIPTPLALSAAIQPVRLPSGAQALNTFVGHEAVISGWGAATMNAGPQTFLRYTYVRVIRNTVCKNHYAYDRIPETVLCTQGVSNQGGCDMDNGGPLVMNEAGTPTQIAIFSFGSPNQQGGCASFRPRGYTRTGHYLGWINEITGLTIR